MSRNNSRSIWGNSFRHRTTSSSSGGCTPLDLLNLASNRVLVVDDLNNCNLLGCHLTAQDVRNGRTLFVPCHGCITGKLTTAVAQTTSTEPAAFVDQHLHIDFIILEGRSIGGILVLTA